VVDFSEVVLLVSLSFFFSAGFSVEGLSELDDDEDEDRPAPEGERWSVE